MLCDTTHNKSTGVALGRDPYLFVGQHEYHSVAQLIFLQHFEELILGLTNTLSVIAVHNKDDTWNKNNIHQTGTRNAQWDKNLQHTAERFLVMF